MKALPLRSLAVFATLAGCGDPAPERPTWVDDVEPILRGNCFHCHGSGANIAIAQLRWDFQNPEAVPMEIGSFPGITPAGAHVGAFLTTKSYQAGSATRMPPAPASVLSDREVGILLRWQMQGSPRGMRRPNHDPTAAWIVPGKSFEVKDADHEQVLGRITCGAASEQLSRSGAHDLPAGAQPPCAVKLFDGEKVVPNVPLR